MATVTWDKAQRDKAKAEQLQLVCVSVDGRPAGKGRMDYHAPVPKEIADKVWEFMTGLMAECRAAKRPKE